MEAVVKPLPTPLITPPVTTTYLGPLYSVATLRAPSSCPNKEAATVPCLRFSIVNR